MQQAAINQFLADSEAAGRRLTWLLVIMDAVTVCTGAALSLATTRSITLPFRDAVAIEKRVAAGNALVAGAGRQMDEIVAAVRHVAEIMNEITEASREQSAGIEEINRAIATMDEMTPHNAALMEEAAAAQAMQSRAHALGQAVAAFAAASLKRG